MQATSIDFAFTFHNVDPYKRAVSQIVSISLLKISQHGSECSCDAQVWLKSSRWRKPLWAFRMILWIQGSISGRQCNLVTQNVTENDCCGQTPSDMHNGQYLIKKQVAGRLRIVKEQTAGLLTRNSRD